MGDVVCDRDGWTAAWEVDRLPHLETSALAAEPLRLLAFVMTHNDRKVSNQWTVALFTVVYSLYSLCGKLYRIQKYAGMQPKDN